MVEFMKRTAAECHVNRLKIDGKGGGGAGSGHSPSRRLSPSEDGEGVMESYEEDTSISSLSGLRQKDLPALCISLIVTPLSTGYFPPLEAMELSIIYK